MTLFATVNKRNVRIKTIEQTFRLSPVHCALSRKRAKSLNTADIYTV